MNKKLLLLASMMFAANGTVLASDHGQGKKESPEKHEAHWGYSGEHGPETWGEMKDEFAACGKGKHQSPIDISHGETIKAEPGHFEFNYKDSPLKVINNGHTIQANYAPGSTLTINGKTYELLQMHFHSPSEHTVNGKSYPIELHLVHKNKEGALAVVGVMMEKGAENSSLATLWKNMPKAAGPEQTIEGATISAAAMLPKNTNSYYHYRGSLTTPPCTESVEWYVLKAPATLSDTQVASFVSAVGQQNARPVQPLHRRFVLQHEHE